MDRNARSCARFSRCLKSLSARRAWIEIALVRLKEMGNIVALRKESVDRNLKRLKLIWRYLVALRKESVDRNAYGRRITRKITRRSPQGERG